MLEFKLQLGCLGIILYLSFMYAKETKCFQCNKFFDALLYISPWAVFFDGFSYWTVNHMDLIPAWLNYAAHFMFFILMIAGLTASTLNIYGRTAGFRKGSRTKWVIMAPGIIAVILVIAGLGNLQFLQGEHTNYSMGFSVYVCFITVFLYYGFIWFTVISKRHYLPEQKRIGALSFVTFVGVILIAQIIFPEFLVTSLALTILVVGLYIEFENPSIRIMENQNQKIIDNFATMVEERDNNTGGHIKRIRLYVSLLLKKMQQDELYRKMMTPDYIRNVEEAAPLHDIGKISTPDEILQKPGKLTPEEYEIMKQHAAKGGEIIQEVFGEMKTPEEKKIAYEVARHHHEKFNGKGYPDGLAGEQIPLHARVMAIADVFDAVSQKRCYKEAMPLEQCFEIIGNGAGTDFDPNLVKLFLESRDVIEELCVINSVENL